MSFIMIVAVENIPIQLIEKLRLEGIEVFSNYDKLCVSCHCKTECIN